MKEDICPKFASCITPCVYGRKDYYYVLHTCLSSEWKNCAHALAPDIQNFALDHLEKDEMESTSCPNQAICAEKQFMDKPLEEYAERVCQTEEFKKCLYFITWILSERPPGRLDSLEVDFEHAEWVRDLPGKVMRRLQQGAKGVMET